jgi:hypothetical protein
MIQCASCNYKEEQATKGRESETLMWRTTTQHGEGKAYFCSPVCHLLEMQATRSTIISYDTALARSWMEKNGFDESEIVKGIKQILLATGELRDDRAV